LTEKAPLRHPVVRRLARLVGKTAGLAQTTGVKTADGLLAAGRQAGKVLAVPAKLRSLVARETEKKQKAEVQRAIRDLRSRIVALYTRIGKRVHTSPQADRFQLSADPQLEAMVSMVRDLEAEIRQLEEQLPGGLATPQSPEREESAPTVASPGLRTEDAPVGESASAPAAAVPQEPPSGAA
jgi:hypothetical protein